jgi:hypothetical protein
MTTEFVANRFNVVSFTEGIEKGQAAKNRLGAFWHSQWSALRWNKKAMLLTPVLVAR